MGSLTIPRAIYKVTETSTSTPSRHCWWTASWLVLTGQCFFFHMAFLVSASVTNGAPNVMMLHGNKTWWRIRNEFLTLSASSLSLPPATKRQCQHFLSWICMWQHLLWRKKGTFLGTFVFPNALTLQQRIFLLAQLGCLLFLVTTQVCTQKLCHLPPALKAHCCTPPSPTHSCTCLGSYLGKAAAET